MSIKCFGWQFEKFKKAQIRTAAAKCTSIFLCLYGTRETSLSSFVI